MDIIKRIISVFSIIMCVTIIWIPIHFALKTLMYGDKRSQTSKTETRTKNL